MNTNTPTIDAVKTVRDPFCTWCGRSDDETGHAMREFATLHDGQLFWSNAMCDEVCHDEAFAEAY